MPEPPKCAPTLSLFVLLLLLLLFPPLPLKVPVELVDRISAEVDATSEDMRGMLDVVEDDNCH